MCTYVVIIVSPSVRLGEGVEIILRSFLRLDIKN
jgi:hypothetical protein